MVLVDQVQRATLRVGFILDTNISKKLIDTESVSERIITILVRVGLRFPNYIQVYVLCNNTYTEEEKEEIFGMLAGVLDKTVDSEDFIVMGDANGKVNRRTTPWEAYLGPYIDRESRI